MTTMQKSDTSPIIAETEDDAAVYYNDLGFGFITEETKTGYELSKQFKGYEYELKRLLSGSETVHGDEVDELILKMAEVKSKYVDLCNETGLNLPELGNVPKCITFTAEFIPDEIISKAERLLERLKVNEDLKYIERNYCNVNGFIQEKAEYAYTFIKKMEAAFEEKDVLDLWRCVKNEAKLLKKFKEAADLMPEQGTLI